MFFKITVDNLNDRILNVTLKETYSSGQVLRVADHIGSTSILYFTCQRTSDVASIVSTLQTDPKVTVLFVENSDGDVINFNILREDARPYFNRYTLTLSA